MWNEQELFEIKMNYLKLKFMKRNVLGVSLQGMSPSIDKTLAVYRTAGSHLNPPWYRQGA